MPTGQYTIRASPMTWGQETSKKNQTQRSISTNGPTRRSGEIQGSRMIKGQNIWALWLAHMDQTKLTTWVSQDDLDHRHFLFIFFFFWLTDVALTAFEVSFKQKYPGDFKISGFRLPARRSDRRLSRREEILAIPRPMGPKPELSPTFYHTQHHKRSSSRGGGFGDQRGGHGVDCCCRVCYGRWDGVQFNDGFSRCERWEKETYRKTSKMR